MLDGSETALVAFAPLWIVAANELALGARVQRRGKRLCRLSQHPAQLVRRAGGWPWLLCQDLGGHRYLHGTFHDAEVNREFRPQSTIKLDTAA